MPKTSQPFMTIVTRCCLRPAALIKCIKSVVEQTDQGIEQIFIVDNKRRGLKWANRQFDTCQDRVDGLYVYMLDDDGWLVSPDFVRLVRKLAKAKNWPDVILVRSIMYDGRIMPPKKVWRLNWAGGSRPEHWIGNGYCFVVKADVWKQFTPFYHKGMGITWHTGGDWHFATQMFGSKVRVEQMDVTGGRSAQRGKGARFERKVGGRWFGNVAAQFGLEDVGDQDWRLRLWFQGS